jgi:eukaryotic-like serine/threonine-protein kinase
MERRRYDMKELAGQEIGNYRLLRLLEHDSSASVYFGEQKDDRSWVAVKIMGIQGENRRIEQWNAETNLLRSLDHPHIVRVRECGIQDSMRFLVTDWAAQGTLLDLFTKSVPISIVTIFVKQIAYALQYLHTRHIVHRDIKPKNILIEQDRNVLLADFELAVDYRSCQRKVGTPAYTAPEQWEGRPCPASDQYALGVLTYQWLCGELPFRGSSTEMLLLYRNASLPPLRDKFPLFPYGVDQVLLTALAKDPDSRFTNVQTFAEALEQACRSSSYWTPSQILGVVDSSTERPPVED